MTTSVLIAGVGIAGPTLAYWLRHHGFSPTLVEAAPALRTGGYAVDFWGLGYDIAERMGLLAAIHRVGYRVREARIVGDRGQRVSGFAVSIFGDLTGGRYVTVRRSDLSRLLFGTIEGGAEVLFGDQIVDLQEEAEGVRVRFQHAGERRFDLVVGADGLHSGVRRLVFGPEDHFEKRLGYTAAAFEAAGYRPRDEDVFVMYDRPGRQLARFAARDDRTLFFFCLASDADAKDVAAQKAILRDRFKDGGWECGRILAELERAPALYFDRVSQIRMDRWSRGRVALIGDAAFCVSLLAGQGAALAMTAAYVLAGELARAQGNHQEAFHRYESLLRPYLAGKQRLAERFASGFVPKTRAGLFVRNQLLKALRLPLVARLASRDMIDQLKLPDYP